MRETFIFYRSFYEALRELPAEDRHAVLDAVMDYQFGENQFVLTGIPKTIFTLIKPQLDANNRRYENGRKGGRPPKETEQEPGNNLTETKPKANNNNNKNVNKNNNAAGSLGSICEGLVGVGKEQWDGLGYEGQVIRLSRMQMGDLYRKHWNGPPDKFREWIVKRDQWYAKQPAGTQKNWIYSTTKTLQEMK